MLKWIGFTNVALAPLFVLPAVTGQEDQESSFDAQLNSTLLSIEYLMGLKEQALSGDSTAIDSITKLTEPPRRTSAQRGRALTSLQGDVARLRFELDRILNEPEHRKAVSAMSPNVVRTLGLVGAPAPAPQMIDAAPPASGGVDPAGTPTANVEAQGDRALPPIAAGSGDGTPAAPGYTSSPDSG